MRGVAVHELDRIGREFPRTSGQCRRGEQHLHHANSPPCRKWVNGMVGIADEVGNGKIADPFTERDTRLVESQFSFNSLLDFQDNIRSIQNVYTGGYNVEAVGLDEFVKSKNPALDQRFQAEIQTAIEEIGKISFPFRDALTTDGPQITAAQQAIATVQRRSKAIFCRWCWQSSKMRSAPRLLTPRRCMG